jgi:4'-phosphopantetheinyl transferase EntD
MELGLPPAAIPSGYDGAPVWPEGVVGSISHCATLGVAALGLRRHGYRSIGVDVETSEPLELYLADELCSHSERAWLGQQPQELQGLFLKLVFSAKEAAYKCQFPLSRTLLEFDALEVRFDLDTNRFAASFTSDVLPFKRGDVINGRFRVTGAYIATAAVLTDADLQ